MRLALGHIVGSDVSSVWQRYGAGGERLWCVHGRCFLIAIIELVSDGVIDFIWT